MKKLNVLLVCGSGASSGFMAANMRKAASKQGLEIDIKARSESEIENYIDEIDYYSSLDGEKAIAHLMEEMNK